MLNFSRQQQFFGSGGLLNPFGGITAFSLMTLFFFSEISSDPETWKVLS